MEHKQLQSDEAEVLLRTLLIGAEISTFEFWADFIIRLERDMSRHSQQQLTRAIPAALWLRLEAEWRVGDQQHWEDKQAAFPIQELRRFTTRNAPIKAAVIAQMLGSTITNISIFSDGTLDIETSDDVTLSVSGVSNSHDHSWSIERRDDEFHVTELVILCEPDGKLFGRSENLVPRDC